MSKSMKNNAVIIIIILNILVLCVATYKTIENDDKEVQSSTEMDSISELVEIINEPDELNENNIENMIKLIEKMEKEKEKNEDIFDKLLQSNIIYILCAVLVSFDLLFKWWDDFEYQAKRFRLYFLKAIRKLIQFIESYIMNLIVIMICYLELDVIYDTIYYNNNMSFVLELNVVNNLNYGFYYLPSIIFITLSVVSVVGIIKNRSYGFISSLILYGLIISVFCCEAYIYEMPYNLINTITIYSALTLSLIIFTVLKYKSLNMSNSNEVKDV